tara:strand:- start:131 stop:295 length:165 start_codon:yes stop_codon:yes gene_type:complete
MAGLKNCHRSYLENAPLRYPPSLAAIAAIAGLHFASLSTRQAIQELKDLFYIDL